MAYELPDGNTVEVGTDRFVVPELMFNPTPLNVSYWMSSTHVVLSCSRCGINIIII